jgi:hypothetical protein
MFKCFKKRRDRKLKEFYDAFNEVLRVLDSNDKERMRKAMKKIKKVLK